MDDSTLQTVLANTYTKSDFYQRIDLVQECLERTLYDNDDSNDGAGRAKRCADHARAAGNRDAAEHIEEWGEEMFAVFTAQNVYDVVKELKTKVEAVPELVLYVPTALSPEGINVVGGWCREKLDGLVMLTLVVEPGVVGGCAFAWNGQYHDFSLKYFMDKKEGEIASLIETYDAK